MAARPLPLDRNCVALRRRSNATPTLLALRSRRVAEGKWCRAVHIRLDTVEVVSLPLDAIGALPEPNDRVRDSLEPASRNAWG